MKIIIDSWRKVIKRRNINIGFFFCCFLSLTSKFFFHFRHLKKGGKLFPPQLEWKRIERADFWRRKILRPAKVLQLWAAIFFSSLCSVARHSCQSFCTEWLFDRSRPIKVAIQALFTRKFREPVEPTFPFHGLLWHSERVQPIKM